MHEAAELTGDDNFVALLGQPPRYKVRGEELKPPFRPPHRGETLHSIVRCYTTLHRSPSPSRGNKKGATLEYNRLEGIGGLYHTGFGRKGSGSGDAFDGANLSEERIADSDGFHLVGVIIVEIHHLNMRPETNDFLLDSLLEADNDGDGDNHDKHADNHTPQRHPYGWAGTPAVRRIGLVAAFVVEPLGYI